MRALTLAVLCAAFVVSAAFAGTPTIIGADGKPIDPKNWKKGCTAEIGSNGNALYEKALIVARRIMPVGESDEFYLYFPERPAESKDRVLNVPAAIVVLDGRARFIRSADGKRAFAQCPPFYWGSGLSAARDDTPASRRHDAGEKVPADDRRSSGWRPADEP